MNTINCNNKCKKSFGVIDLVRGLLFQCSKSYEVGEKIDRQLLHSVSHNIPAFTSESIWSARHSLVKLKSGETVKRNKHAICRLFTKLKIWPSFVN